MKHIMVETYEATLPSVGYNGRRWTRHRYAHSKIIQVRGDRGTMLTGLAHYYRCTETGELRVWGFDVPPTGN